MIASTVENSSPERAEHIDSLRITDEYSIRVVLYMGRAFSPYEDGGRGEASPRCREGEDLIRSASTPTAGSSAGWSRL